MADALLKPKKYSVLPESVRVSLWTIAANLGLTGLKLAAGLLGHSNAMVSDAVQSAGDVLSTLVALIGIWIAGRKADANHRYGHERYESLASMILALLLVGTALGIGKSGVESILAWIRGTATLEAPTLLPIFAALATIATKGLMYFLTRRVARHAQSPALWAMCADHRSDVFVSCGTLLAILGARLGWPVLDPIASLLICLLILKAAGQIGRSAVAQLTDESASKELQQRLRNTILAQEGVLCIDDLKTRQAAARLYVDVEIGLDATLSLETAHNIAERVHLALETEYPDVKHCMVHTNPVLPEEAPPEAHGRT